MSAYETKTDRGFLLSGREWKAIGGGAALMTLNVLLMYVFVATPLATVNDLLFSIPIVGVLIYGAAIYAGESLAEKGVEAGNVGLALGGVAILQLAFGTFGAGILPGGGSQLTILGITAVVVAIMTAGIGTYVYARSIDFDHYSTWSTYAFLGGLGAVLVGSFLSSMLPLILGFVLIFTGFILRLGWEIWRIRDARVDAVSLQAIGLYVAVAGVFVHVLQIVVRIVGRR